MHPSAASGGGGPRPGGAEGGWARESTEGQGRGTAQAGVFTMGGGAIQETPELQGHKVRAMVTLYNEE